MYLEAIFDMLFPFAIVLFGSGCSDSLVCQHLFEYKMPFFMVISFIHIQRHELQCTAWECCTSAQKTDFKSKPIQTKPNEIYCDFADSIVELQKCVRIKNVYKSSRSEKCVNDTVNEFAQKVLGRAYCNWNENTPNMNEIL